MKKNDGITLLVLVVTILVLLILTGVVINTITNDTSIFKNAQKSKEDMRMAELKEDFKYAWTKQEMAAFDATDMTDVQRIKIINDNLKLGNVVDNEIFMKEDGSSVFRYEDNEKKEEYDVTVDVEGENKSITFEKALIPLVDAEIAPEDYIDYPYSYTNVMTANPTDSSKTAKPTLTGWKCLINLTDENGERVIKIVSAGVPENLTIDPAVECVEGNLTEEKEYDYKEDKVKASEIISVHEKGQTYFLNKYARSYGVLSVTDCAILSQKDGCNGEMIKNGAYYWINLYNKDNGLCYYDILANKNTGGEASTKKAGTTGIRPVMTLRNDLYVYREPRIVTTKDGKAQKHWEFPPESKLYIEQ